MVSCETFMPVAFAAYDCEATGLNVKSDRILQLGAAICTGCVDVLTGEFHMDLKDPSKVNPDQQEFETFQEFVQCKQELSPKIRELTGIEPENVVDARPFREVLESFSLWVQKFEQKRLDTTLILLTYNGMNYDMQLMANHLARADVNVEAWFNIIRARAHVDVMHSIGATWSLKKFSQTKVFRDAFGYDFSHAHSAAADAVATLKLFLKYKKVFHHSSLDIQTTLVAIARDSGLPIHKVYDSRIRDLSPPETLHFGPYSCALRTQSVIPVNTRRPLDMEELGTQYRSDDEMNESTNEFREMQDSFLSDLDYDDDERFENTDDDDRYADSDDDERMNE